LLSTMMMLPTRISFAGFIENVRKKQIAENLLSPHGQQRASPWLIERTLEINRALYVVFSLH
jgi:hypothetical protein